MNMQAGQKYRNKMMELITLIEGLWILKSLVQEIDKIRIKGIEIRVDLKVMKWDIVINIIKDQEVEIKTDNQILIRIVIEDIVLLQDLNLDLLPLPDR